MVSGCCGHANAELLITGEVADAQFLDTGRAEARLSAVLRVDGKPAAGTGIVWSVVAVRNESPAMPAGQDAKNTGLSWETAIPANTRPLEDATTVTDDEGRAGIVITDIIGERSVTVRATALHDGREYNAEQELVFGKGPLSLFSAPRPERVSWLELYTVCNGRTYDGDPEQWRIGQGAAGGKKMPTVEQVQAVSLTGKYNALPSAMGAAIAAGWPTDGRYWADGVVMKMRAEHVNLQDGNLHGFGGNSITAKEYGVCLR